MDYRYENLADDQFEQLCHRLLAEEYPSARNIRTWQPIDAHDASPTSSGAALHVLFQQEASSGAGALIEAVASEISKISRLIERGAHEYVIVTNLAEGGASGPLMSWLSEHVSIQSSVKWRNDIDERLHRVPALQLRYPTLAPITELVNGIGKRNPGASERLGVLNSFVKDQQKKDRLVKFQQVDLAQDLESLFVDVPLGIPVRDLTDGDHRTALGDAVRGLNGAGDLDRESRVIGIDGVASDEKDLEVDAEAFLTSPAAQAGVQRVLLHGAPGQGKSTLAQHICQGHRVRWLKAFMDNGVGGAEEPLRLPVKIDLRQLGAFVGRASSSNRSFDHPRSLEAFIASLISVGAGGRTFTVDDVAWVLQNLPVLLFLDGLDEVADLKLREHVVDEIVSALNRTSVQADLQVVITSRPSTFGRSADLSSHGFKLLSLRPLRKAHIDKFADVWMQAQEMTHDERASMDSLLTENLRHPHVKELIRNPMQLTILLSLIGKEGSALPDGRTQLYEHYLRLVMEREGSKSAVVAKNRELLEMFLAHLAWELQLGAEFSGENGSLTLEEIRQNASDFLEFRHQPHHLAEELFDGSERMYVLVERVEGRYEFEVQPMREFLCATHLYTTPPDGSPLNKEPRGDLLARFRALAGNPFWLNVVRFYAGYFRPGELPGVRYELMALIQSGDADLGLHVRIVAKSLLRDRVFRHRADVRADVVALAFDDLGFYIEDGADLTWGIGYPPDGGRQELAERALELSERLWSREGGIGSMHHHPALRILAHNASTNLVPRILGALSGLHGDRLTRRVSDVSQALSSNLLSDIPPSELWRLISDDSPSSAALHERALDMMINGPDSLFDHPSFVDAVVEGALDGRNRYSRHPPRSWVELVFVAASSLDGAIGDLESEYEPEGRSIQLIPDDSGSKFHDQMEKFVRGVEEISSIDRGAASNSDRDRGKVGFAKVVYDAFGSRWISYRGALQIRDFVDAEGAGAPKMIFGSQADPVTAVGVARAHREDAGWFRGQLETAGSVNERMFWVSLVLGICEVSEVADLANEIESTLGSLTEDEFERYWMRSGVDSRRIEAADEVWTSAFGARGALMVGRVFGVDPPRLIRAELLVTSREMRSWQAIEDWFHACNVDPDWGDIASVRAWLRHVTGRPTGLSRSYFHGVERRVGEYLGPEVAAALLDEPHELPGQLAELCADIVLREYKPEPVRVIVDRERWQFE